MTQSIKINLKTLAEKIYGIDLEQYNDFELYEVNSNDIYLQEDDIKRFIKLSHKQYPNQDTNKLSHDELEELTRFAMTSQLETSLMDGAYNYTIKELIKNLEQDFVDVNNSVMYDEIQFDLYNEDITVEEQINVISQSFEANHIENNGKHEFVFTGSFEKLAYTLIASINGEGTFGFESLNDFCDLNEDDDLTFEDLEKTITSHIQWLSKWHDIHHDGIFSLTSDKLANGLNHVNHGSTFITTDDIEHAYDCVVVN